MLPLGSKFAPRGVTRARINQLQPAEAQVWALDGRLARADFPSCLTFFHAKSGASKVFAL